MPTSDRRTLLISLFAGCALFGAPASAQDAVVAEPGARLRVTIANGHQRMSGEYVRSRADSLEFRWSDSKGAQMQMPIPFRDIWRIEISGSRSHPFVRTGLQGLALGAIFGVVGGNFMGIPGCENSGCLTKQEAMATYGLALGGVGLTIGLIRAAKGFDRWVPATVPGWRRP